MGQRRLGGGMLWRDRRGGVAVLFGLAAPALALGVAAAVEYANLVARRTQLQNAADSAAIAAAQQLRLVNNTDEVVLDVARTIVASYAEGRTDTTTVVDGSVGDKRTSVAVQVRETAPGIFGKLFNLPTMELGVRAKARLSGTMRLCLLALDPAQDKALLLDKGSLVTAPGCGVYANSRGRAGLTVETNARITASQICSSGGVDQKIGSLISPVATTDCPQLPDPLAAVARPGIGPCASLLKRKVSTMTTLMPGVYCGGLEITSNADVTLAPGVYVMHDGPLIVSGKAKMSGRDVGFFFTGSKGGMRLDPDTTISLTAPKTGEMAGILFSEDRSIGSLEPILPPIGPKLLPPPPPGSQPMRTYQISSNNAPVLLGTIYLPAGRLVIDAARSVAERSTYTVIVAKQVDLNSGPNLVLNSDYEGSDVPVPPGVGPNSGAVSLWQ